jgi:hypothetical protein
LRLGGGGQLLDRADAVAQQASFHGGADAAQLAQLESVEATGQIGVVDNHEAIRLLHIRSRLSQESVGRDADRTAHFGTDLFGDARLNLLAEADSVLPLLLAASQFTTISSIE